MPRRNSKKPSPGYTPPRLTNSYVGGRPPLTLVTYQDPFRATPAQTVEAEPSQFKTFQQDTQDAPVPPRPSTSPLSPRSSRRQSVRTDTDETLSPVSESPSQFQSPNISSPTSIPSRKPTLGKDTDEFARPPPIRHWSGHENSHQHAADSYSYQFGTAPSPPTKSGPSHYTSADVSGGVYAHVWPVYNRISQESDQKLFSRWNFDLDVLLIFSTLLSAVIISSLVTSVNALQPNYQQQSALLLYQQVYGRNDTLESLSNPMAPFNPSVSAIATNCLWFASLFVALAAGFGAMFCKQWQAEYNNGMDPAVDLLRACRRQNHFVTFQGWNVQATAFLPPLLLFSIFLFFAGAVIFLWEVNRVVAAVFSSFGVIFFLIYTILLPVVKKTPFRPYSIIILYRLCVLVGYIVIPIVDRIAQGCFIVLRYLTYSVLGRFARAFFGKDTLRTCTRIARSILPRKYQHMRVWWEDRFDDSLDQIDISPQVQEEAILWLSQMPLNPSETKAVVSSLALISPSRPHKFPKSVVVFLNSALESSCRGDPSRARIDSVLALGRIKYQSVVDKNRDRDHTVMKIPVTALVAYAAQQLTISAFEGDFSTPHSEGIRARLLAATAWLSPVDAGEEETPEGEPLAIQGRREFVEQIGITVKQHFRGERPLNNGVLVDLIHGMHASIPRGDYGTRASIIPFPLSKDRSSPWSEDESVLRALITYALDLLSYTEGKRRLVEREIKLDDLALDLIDTLCGSIIPAAPANPIALTALATLATPAVPAVPAAPATLTALGLAAPPVPPEVAVFSFWLIHRFPHAFKSRRTMLADVGDIWNSTKITIAEDHDNRKRLNFHAVDAFIAVARHHLVVDRELPRFWADEVMNLLKAALEDSDNRPMVTYALALILNLGTSNQAAEISKEIDVEFFADTFNTVRSDPEANAVEEDVLDLYIHTALLLFKLKQPPADIGRVKALVGEMGETIKGVVVGQGPVSKKGSEDETIMNTDRVRWKAVYLCGLLVGFLPLDEREERIKGLRTTVETTVQTGELSIAEDYKRCLKPLGGQVKLQSPAERKGKSFTAFETWIKNFPLLPSAGSVLSHA